MVVNQQKEILETLLDAGVILVDKPRGPSKSPINRLQAREMLGIQEMRSWWYFGPFCYRLAHQRYAVKQLG